MATTVDSEEYFWPNIFNDIEFLNNSTGPVEMPDIANLNASVFIYFFLF